MFWGKIDNKFDVHYISPSIQVRDGAKVIGYRHYILEHLPVAGFDVVDSAEIERLACEVVDEYTKPA